MISSAPPSYLAPEWFKIRSADGKILTFDLKDDNNADRFVTGDVYHLTSIVDAKGNSMSLAYDTLGDPTLHRHRLSSVTDTYGRVITFGYNGIDLLTSVTDFTGRTISFGHNDPQNGYNLTDVTSPAVLTVISDLINYPNGNTFPGGKTVHYKYNDWVALSGVLNNCLILQVTDAQEVANSGLPYLTNKYDNNARVITQVFGTPDSPEVPSGGEYAFIYETTGAGNFWNWFTEARRTMCVDPNGNVTLHLFDADGSDRLAYTFAGRVSPNAIDVDLPYVTAISDVVSINPALHENTDHIIFPGAQSKLHANDPGCFWVRKDYDVGIYTTRGLVTHEITASSDTKYTYDTSTDPLQQGNLLKIERIPVPAPVPDDGSTHLITLRAYEPVFGQLRAIIDELGNKTLNYCDYQEGSIGAGTPISDLVSTWTIDTAQAYQSEITSIPSIQGECSKGDLNGDGVTVVPHGNLIVTQFPDTHILSDPVNSGTPDSTPQTAQILITYNAYSLPATVKDPEGQVTTFLYSPNNDPTGQGQTPPSTGDGGLLRTKNSPEGVTEQFAYDELGRLREHKDGRGLSSVIVHNELDQIVQTQDALGYLHDYVFDYNNNLIEEQYSNKAPVLTADGMPTSAEGGGWIVNRYEYDILDQRIKEDIQADAQTRLVTQYRYDRARNRVLTLFPESGVDASGVVATSNVVSQVFDERNRVWKQTRGGVSAEFIAQEANLGMPSIPESSLKSTVTTDYDLAGQILSVTSGQGRVSTFSYDGFERQIKATDPSNNCTETHYDAASRVIETDRWEGPTGTGTLIGQTKNSYDERGRLYQVDQKLFPINASAGVVTPDGLLSPGDGGFVTTRTRYDRNSNPKQIVNDNKHSIWMDYDGLNRLITRHDGLNNTTTTVYDKNSNVITTDQLDVDSGGGNTHYVTQYFYDKLDRKTAVVDNMNEATRFMYDSRGNLVFTSDAARNALVGIETLDVLGEHAGLTGQVNDHGNNTVNSFDDAGRLLASTRFLRLDGTGDTALHMTEGGGDGRITVSRSYDPDSRLKTIRDDNNNETRYSYDVLNRLSSTANVSYSTQYANSTFELLDYDLDDLVLHSTDANGSIVTNVYDPSGRLASRTIQLSASAEVIGPTSESYTYDGANRVITANNGVSVVRRYDSLGRVIQDTIDGKTTTTIYDGVGNLRECKYPGLRDVIRSYDIYDRLGSIIDVGPGINVASYHYVGAHRLESRDYPNGIRLTPSYDGAQRVLGTDHANGTVPVDTRTYTWDRVSNKTSRTEVLTTGNRVHDYHYDSAYRMLQSTRTVGGIVNQATSYTLDGVGNRTVVAGDVNPGSYIMNDQITPSDRKVNQYTETPGTQRTYDLNGNLTHVTGVKNVTIAYDYHNQMMAYTNVDTSKLHTYSYDALGRRVAKTVDANTGSPQVTKFFYCGWDVVEEQDGTGTTKATYVYGNGLDEVLSMQRGGRDYYYHADDMGNVMKLTNNLGVVKESYEYGDYGEVLDGQSMQPINPVTQLTLGNPYLFTGARYDKETGLYHLRTRYLEPSIGRFTSRDSIGIWGDPASLGNGKSYAGNNPWSALDPNGQKCTQPIPPSNWQIRKQAQQDRYDNMRDEFFSQRENEDVRGDCRWTGSNGMNNLFAGDSIRGNTGSSGMGHHGNVRGDTNSHGFRGEVSHIDIVCCIKVSCAQNAGRSTDNTSYWKLGWEWVLGSRQEHHFTDGDPATELLRRHSNVQEVRDEIAAILSMGVDMGPLIHGNNDYELDGLTGVLKYVQDYANIPTGGNLGNLAATYLGSYELQYDVFNIDYLHGTADIHFQVNNWSTVASLAHPPYFGYLEVWKNNITPVINRLTSGGLFGSGVMKPTHQVFDWYESMCVETGN
jgi:RHS repeat-associated protein